MSMSFEEGLGIAAKPSAPAPGVEPAKPTTIGFEEGLGITPSKPGATKYGSPAMETAKFELSELHKAFNDHIDSALASQYKNSGEALSHIRQGLHDALGERDESKILPTKNWGGVGEGLLGLMSYITSPLTTVVDEVASKPSALVVDKVASMIPTAPSLKPGETRSKFDTAIRPEDVQQTSAALNDFLSTAYQTAAGFVGAGGALKSAERGALDLLTPEAKAEFRSRQPRAEATLDQAFEELAATDPEGASALAAKVAPVDENLSKKMEATRRRVLPYNEANLQAIGAQKAKLDIADAEATARTKQRSLDKAVSPPAKEPPPPQPIVSTRQVGQTQADYVAAQAKVKADAMRHSRMLARTQDMQVAETIAQSTSKAMEVGLREPPKLKVKLKPQKSARETGVGNEPLDMTLSPAERAVQRENAAARRLKEEGLSREPHIERIPKRAATHEGEVARRKAEDLHPDAQALDTVARSFADDGSVVAVQPKLTYFHSGINVPMAFSQVRETKAGQILEGKLHQYYDSIIRNINPEALGEDAKKGAAIIARGIASLAREDSKFVHRGEERIRYWAGEKSKGMDFINKFEKGQDMGNAEWNTIAHNYREWDKNIVAQDHRAGVVAYDEQDHYLPHMYADPEAARKALTIKYGPSWTQPGFTKARGFETYADALKEGKKYEARGEKNPFKPKFENPEMLMQARQHASDLAEMKISILKDLEKYKLAVRKETGDSAPGPDYSAQPSPAGGSYWVKNDAHQVLHNAFNSKTLWNMQGITSDAFRGAMFLKNAKVQTQLSLSLYHALHLGLAMDSSTEMVRATKELLAGKTNPVNWLARVVASPLGAFTWNPVKGYRPLRAYRGLIKDGELTSHDKVVLKAMAEGGFIPEMSSQYRTKAFDNFRRALKAHSAKAAWHLPFAALELMSKPMFDYWIPQLKIASYVKDIQTSLKLNPELIKDDLGRMQAFRKIAKSVDNRYGEMAYNTMFFNRWVKDLAVANTLSLGWQVGFIREFGGGMLDVGQALTKPGSIVKKAKSGMLDRPLMLTFYGAQALGIGGLMTWGMTHEPPKTLKDYYLPRTGGTNPDGSEARVNTMFYTKEIASFGKHVETQGVGTGLSNLVASKASGLIGLALEAYKGINDWGEEIRDPNDKWYNQVGQTLSAMAPELEPISITAVQKQVGSNLLDKAQRDPGATVRAIAGFTPAPKYMTESATDARIDQTYNKYYAKKQTPYEKAQYSKETRELKQLHEASDEEGFDEKLQSIQDKYSLTEKEIRKLRTRSQKDSDPQLAKFKGFSDNWQLQKDILDKATPEEREKLLPLSNKVHLRHHYEEPVE